MIVSKRALSRRTFLRGIGTTLALPLLDAMVPPVTALADTPADPSRTRCQTATSSAALGRTFSVAGKGLNPKHSFKAACTQSKAMNEAA